MTSNTSQDVSLLIGSITTEHPLLLGASADGDVEGVGGGELAGVDEAMGAVDGAADGAGAIDGADGTADAGGFGTDADTQRKWALNLKCRWSSFSSTHVPLSRRCPASSMM